MPVYNKDSKLADIIIYDPSVIQVINRFGILLGVGDYPVKDICKRYNIDVNFFLAIINTYLNSEYIPKIQPDDVTVKQLEEYLRQADNYYAKVLIPNIERHINILVAKSEDKENNNSNISYLLSFFKEVKKELLSPDTFYNIKKEKPEDKISDLLRMFVTHLHGDFDSNLCVGVTTALWTLEKDVRQNNRIRKRLFNVLCQR